MTLEPTRPESSLEGLSFLLESSHVSGTKETIDTIFGAALPQLDRVLKSQMRKALADIFA